MEYDLILARSVTYAQRMQRALNRAGIRSQLFRAPRDLTDLGCAYVVRISPYDLGAALPLLRREGLGPLRIYVQRQMMPKWKPGKQRGKAVRVKYTVPVTFKLQ